MRLDSSVNTRWRPRSSVVKFGSEQARDFPTAFTTERDRTRSWSSRLATAEEDPDSGAPAGSHINALHRTLWATRSEMLSIEQQWSR